MVTAQALAICIFTAAQTYGVPPALILGILHVEGGRVGMASKNTNNTYDLGPMQINTIWIPELARHWGVTRETAHRMVRDDACVNIGVGTWILRKKINQTGSLYQGIAYYHSATPHLGGRYRAKVMDAMQRYRLVRSPDDLIAASRRQSAPAVKRNPG